MASVYALLRVSFYVYVYAQLMCKQLYVYMYVNRIADSLDGNKLIYVM